MVKLALHVHKKSIKNFGGRDGIRNKGLLISSIYTPCQTFGDFEPYSNDLEKISKILELIIKNHPFFDGNKRTAYLLTRILLRYIGFDIEATEDEKFNFLIKIAKNEITFSEIKNWIEKHIIRV
ncbi:hypothetical protein BLW93_07875 [Desulfurobacterium indicum]|uniref:Fido domain-containing protein n=1 Tax=Desulfurobacterium indicum TaxID=1914305 RepID=A0A1R1MJS3_9BACT|nr:hypothetical protein BLW93_07875 [Desulfurobacterium indicum]